MNPIVLEKTISDRTISMETGRMAKQADGAVIVRCGDTMVLVTAVVTKEVREGTDFLPLTCDYLEKTYSAGRIPGGFFKREGRPSEKEVLTSRLIDRPLRPLFPKGFYNETQIIASVLSKDDRHEGDVLAITGASAALHISQAPFLGPVAAVRVGCIGEELIANPTHEQMQESILEIVVAANRDAIVMVEGEANFVSEELMIKALLFGFNACQPLIDMQDELKAQAGKPKLEFVTPAKPEALIADIKNKVGVRMRAALTVPDKGGRREALHNLRDEIYAAFNEGRPEDDPFPYKEFVEAFDEIKKETARRVVLEENIRIDGRQLNEVRPITIETGILPRTHGSALFTRGETQAIATITLGTSSDEQKIDGLLGEEWRRFLLHYNFPPFCVGEAKFLRSPGRREIGHGNLARRSLNPVLPNEEEFPYTIRVVSDILESNGSSSMATVCGGSLAMMDAGIPTLAPVAGVAMGLVMGENGKYAVLTDILGDEDHMGDMDFKVAGTFKGITAIQMDIKIGGITEQIFTDALEQAKQGRLYILKRMKDALPKPRPDLSPYAPRITTIQIPVDKIRDVIGPGGKTIRSIIEETGVKIDVEDDGRVLVASADGEAAKRAIKIIQDLTAEAEVDKYYLGRVARIEPFGAFVTILPGVDGLLHISEIDNKRINKVEDVLQLDDEVLVKVLEIDKERGRIRLSRRAALNVKPEEVLEK